MRLCSKSHFLGPRLLSIRLFNGSKTIVRCNLIEHLVEFPKKKQQKNSPKNEQLPASTKNNKIVNY